MTKLTPKHMQLSLSCLVWSGLVVFLAGIDGDVRTVEVSDEMKRGRGGGGVSGDEDDDDNNNAFLSLF